MLLALARRAPRDPRSPAHRVSVAQIGEQLCWTGCPGSAIASSAVVIAAANEASAGQGNLPATGARPSGHDPDGPVLSLPEIATGGLDAMQASVQGWAATLDDATVVALPPPSTPL